MKLKHALFLIFIQTAVISISAQKDTIKYSFFVAGHTYENDGTKMGLNSSFLEKFDYIRSRPEIKFGILTGDIVSSNPTAEDWDYVDAELLELEIPVYFTAGNHDMENRELFVSRYGETYYSFQFEKDLFIILDPNINNWNISGEQLSFLLRTIEDNTESVDNIFVFFHQVLWWKENSVYKDYRPNSFAGRADTINFWSEIEPLFSSLSNPVFFFAGDVGAGSWSADFMYDKYQNISFIASGMGEGIGDNFIVTNVHSDKTISYDLVCLNDSVLNCFGSLDDYKLSSQSVTIDNKLKVRVYPNPAKYKFKVEVLSQDNGGFAFLLFDTLGNNVVTKKVKSLSKIEIRTEMLEGIYYYRVQQNGIQLGTGKILIQK